MTYLNGMPVIVNPNATAAIPEERWDWSGYRSPSRAKRRRDRSKIKMREPACFQMGNKLVVHPVLWERLRLHVPAREAQP